MFGWTSHVLFLYASLDLSNSRKPLNFSLPTDLTLYFISTCSNANHASFSLRFWLKAESENHSRPFPTPLSNQQLFFDYHAQSGDSSVTTMNRERERESRPTSFRRHLKGRCTRKLGNFHCKWISANSVAEANLHVAKGGFRAAAIANMKNRRKMQSALRVWYLQRDPSPRICHLYD